VIVATSLGQGKIKGFQTLFGTSAAMLIQLIITALATSWFVGLLADGFQWLKWGGVVYLFVLGVSSFYRTENERLSPTSGLSCFRRGFIISLTNPKTILFFSAFLPQFISPVDPYLTQIVLLSAVFLLLAFILDSGYALLAAKLNLLLQNKKLARYARPMSGLVYMGAGSLLATTKSV